MTLDPALMGAGLGAMIGAVAGVLVGRLQPRSWRRPTPDQLQVARAAVAKLTHDELRSLGAVARNPLWWPGYVALNWRLRADAERGG